jgi:hypothetical protein
MSNMILDVKYDSQYPLVQATKSGTALKAVATGISVSETRWSGDWNYPDELSWRHRRRIADVTAWESRSRKKCVT